MKPDHSLRFYRTDGNTSPLVAKLTYRNTSGSVELAPDTAVPTLIVENADGDPLEVVGTLVSAGTGQFSFAYTTLQVLEYGIFDIKINVLTGGVEDTWATGLLTVDQKVKSWT